jgi:hypothetical protein
LDEVNQIVLDHQHEAGTLWESVHGFGLGRHGQLGNSMEKLNRTFALPQAIRGFEDVQITKISANGNHITALTGKFFLSFVFCDKCRYANLSCLYGSPPMPCVSRIIHASPNLWTACPSGGMV